MSTQRQIRCPHCGEQFQIDEQNYESIVKQIRDHTFKEEVEERLKSASDLAVAKAESTYKDKLSEQENKYADLRQKANVELVKKNQEIEALKGQLEAFSKGKDNEVSVAVNNALKEKESLIDKLKDDYNAKLSEKEAQIASLLAQNKQDDEAKASAVSLAVNEAVKEKDQEISRLQSDLKVKDAEKESEIIKAKSEKEKEISELKVALETSKTEAQSNIENTKNKYEMTIKGLEEQVEFYRDFKASQSTKAIGESLEIYCHNEFDKLRATAFPNAYFEKDNTVSKESGSKADFIFRDYDDEGNEFVSIAFEMKNEADATEKKHKNEDFFKELDKDRNEKNCQYAILVTMLESDNELYNQGIVNVSHRYPNMYVIRPQFFLPIIGLIRAEAMKSIEYRKQLELAKNQDIDLSNFEANMNAFKEGFAKNYDLASRKFNTTIEEIDKAIDHLQKTKDALIGCDRNLRLANDKAQDLSVKRLTKNAPSIAKKIQEQS